MPDISMCFGKQCPFMFNCYRFLAKPDTYQSYFTEPPYDKVTNRCEFYWPHEENKNSKKDASK